MQLSRGITRRASTRVRIRFLLPIAIGLFLAASGLALASRMETSPSHINEYTGSNWVGKVSLFFGEIDSPSGQQAFSLSELKFANLCSRRGSEVKTSIRVGKNKLFDFHGHGFSVVGNVIGSLSDPREIAGTASVATHGCQSGPWWFSVKPAPG
jgi:hypothetical protein